MERNIQVILQAVIDISIQLVKFFKIEPPKDEEDIIKSLEDRIENIEILKGMKKFRNFIVHSYGKVDNSIVFENTNQLKKDIPIFLNQIRTLLTHSEK